LSPVKSARRNRAGGVYCAVAAASPRPFASGANYAKEKMSALIVNDGIASADLAVWVTALATLAYVVISLLLWRATKQSAEMTRKIFEQTHRPYVGIQSWELWRDAGTKGHLNCLTLINVGNVPASNVHVNIETFDHSGCIEKATSAEAGFVLFPNQAYTVQVATGIVERVAEENRALAGHVGGIEVWLGITLKIELMYTGPSETNYYFKATIEQGPSRTEFRLGRADSS
jgi:hypothetical protein